MAGFKVNGVDLDTLFEPIGSTSKRADVGYTISGSDISNFYADATLGTPYGTTDYRSNNTDIGTLFAALGSVGGQTLFLYAWGGNSYGEATSEDSKSWISVSAGGFHTAAIRSDYNLFTWGNANYGRLGVAPPFSYVDPGTNHTAALDRNGILFTWGANFTGQLGDGTATSRSSPVQIGANSWTSVSAGANHTLAISSDGKLFAWGENNTGQLGDGTASTPRSSPVQIGTSSWIAVSAGANFSLAIRNDGGLFTWGSGTSARLGLGSYKCWIQT
jgi:alpha-tubulin suppressor-like RCC1 family protein